jgi:hypothetical protein
MILGGAINIPPPTGGEIWSVLARPRASVTAPALWAASTIRDPSVIQITMPPAILTIDRYAKLSSGWDGYDGVTPKTSTVTAAKRLYWALRELAIVDPDVQVAGDGELSLVWNAPHAHFEIGADADGGVSYFGRSSSRARPVMGEVDEHFDSLPVEVCDFLSAVRQWQNASAKRNLRASTRALV